MVRRPASRARRIRAAARTASPRRISPGAFRSARTSRSCWPRPALIVDAAIVRCCASTGTVDPAVAAIRRTPLNLGCVRARLEGRRARGPRPQAGFGGVPEPEPSGNGLLPRGESRSSASPGPASPFAAGSAWICVPATASARTRRTCSAAPCARGPPRRRRTSRSPRQRALPARGQPDIPGKRR